MNRKGRLIDILMIGTKTLLAITFNQ